MSGDYLLNRDTNESTRLDEQHHLWVDSLDYLIHPTIAKSLPTTAQIADVAAGTAAWAIAVAKAKPSSKVTGYDISDAQFPSKSELPANVMCKVQDTLKPFPTEMHGRFDLIHVRLLLLALPDQDAWNNAVKNLMMLLKPGAWLQWEEGDFTTVARPSRSGGVGSQSTKAIRRGLGLIPSIAGERLKQVPEKVLAAFETAGLSEVDMDTVAADRLESNRDLATRMEIGVVEGMQKSWRAEKGQVAPLQRTKEDDDQLLKEMKEEAARGAYCIFFMHCVTGKKPA